MKNKFSVELFTMSLMRYFLVKMLTLSIAFCNILVDFSKSIPSMTIKAESHLRRWPFILFLFIYLFYCLRPSPFRGLGLIEPHFIFENRNLNLIWFLIVMKHIFKLSNCLVQSNLHILHNSLTIYFILSKRFINYIINTI